MKTTNLTNGAEVKTADTRKTTATMFEEIGNEYTIQEFR